MTRILSLYTLLLVACTWRLWFAVSDFPMVPWLPLPDAVGPWLTRLDQIAAALLVGALAGLTIVSFRDPRSPAGGASGMRRFWLLALVALGWLVFTNQHRLQPWAYHFLLSGWILLVYPRERAERLLLVLLCSVYAFSAWNKIDQRFLATTGDLMMRTAASWFHAEARSLPPGSFARAACVLPLGETLLAVGLAYPGTRAAARVLAIVMHTGLLLVLGPWGLQQRWGVLVWNLSFATQAWYLAKATRAPQAAVAASESRPAMQSFGRWMPLAVALFMPVLEPWNLWDHWPSWGLYSARAGRLELLLSAEAADRLPSSAKEFLDPRRVDGVWRRLALDRWSLESLDAPLYPQPRFQWGVCQSVLNRLPRASGPAIVLEHLPPDRVTGRAERRTWGGEEAVRRGTGEFWFNTRPRPSVGWTHTTVGTPSRTELQP